MGAAMAARPSPRSARRSLAAEGTVAAPCLLCRAGAVVCLLPIEQVVEIMRLLPIERIAGASEHVLGLSVIRGAPVPVVDLGLVVADRPAPCTRLVTVRTATGTVALAVEAVLGVTAIADAFNQLPPLLRDAAADTVSAIGARDSELILFLRTGRLVPEEVLARLEAGGAQR
jgi:purine-binding chemotaxis protein CheW